MSRVSVMLSEADDKSWGRDIRCAFKSPQEELLFRSMKVVRPVSHASTGRVDGTAGRNREKERERVSDRGLNATATARLQKHVPCCDLDLHSTQKSKAQHAEERHRLHESIRLAAERMSSLGGASGGGSNRQPSRQNLRTDPTLAFATFDDAKECTFQPRISGKARKLKKRGEEDEDEKEREKDRFAFINRQEAEERNRRDELQFQMGKADYDAKVDKKTCPRCGAKQSFDEFKEKRKNCVHCNVEYCAAVRTALPSLMPCGYLLCCCGDAFLP